MEALISTANNILASVDVDVHVVAGALVGAMAYIATTPKGSMTRMQRFLSFIASWWLGIYAAPPTHRIINAVLSDYIGTEIPFGKPFIAFLMAALGIWVIESIKSGNIGFNPWAVFKGKNRRNDND